MTWYHDTPWQLTDPSVVKERWPGHRGSTARGWEGTHRDLDLERLEKQKPSLQGMLTTLPSVATVTWKMRGGSPFWPGVDCGGGLRTEAPWPLLRCMTITTELSTNATRSMPWMMSCMMSWCHAWPLDSEAPKASNSLVEHMRTAETVLVRNHLCFHCLHRAPCTVQLRRCVTSIIFRTTAKARPTPVTHLHPLRPRHRCEAKDATTSSLTIHLSEGNGRQRMSQRTFEPLDFELLLVFFDRPGGLYHNLTDNQD